MSYIKRQLQNEALVKPDKSNGVVLENHSLDFEKKHSGYQTRSASYDSYFDYRQTTKKKGQK